MMRTRDMGTEIGAELMFRAAQRASARPPFMAGLLARFQEQPGCSEPQLAARARAAAGPVAPPGFVPLSRVLRKRRAHRGRP
jgi:hypothetical protein